MSSPDSASSSSHRGHPWHADGNESSTRTTPEPAHPHQSTSTQAQAATQTAGVSTSHHQSKILAQTHPGQPQRRSSTPAHSFLQPRLFHPTQMYHHGHDASEQDQSAHPAPRRTSFGTALGGRLAALSTFRGAVATGHAWPPRNHHSQSGSSSATASAATSPAIGPVNSREQAPGGQPPPSSLLPPPSIDSKGDLAAPPPAPLPAPQQQPKKQYEPRHMCVPDGCGGFITVEQRSRKPTQS
ncbi:unnamed protein product [Parajaminaea phylloscopi]